MSVSPPCHRCGFLLALGSCTANDHDVWCAGEVMGFVLRTELVEQGASNYISIYIIWPMLHLILHVVVLCSEVKRRHPHSVIRCAKRQDHHTGSHMQPLRTTQASDNVLNVGEMFFLPRCARCAWYAKDARGAARGIS